jgi:hypothetical protein
MRYSFNPSESYYWDRICPVRGYARSKEVRAVRAGRIRGCWLLAQEGHLTGPAKGCRRDWNGPRAHVKGAAKSLDDLNVQKLVGFELGQDLDHAVVAVLAELADDVGANVRRRLEDAQ